MQNFDILTLVFLGLAVFVILKLRSVLGQRTGTERPPGEIFDRRPPAPGEGDRADPSGAASNIVPMPGTRREAAPVEPEARLEGVIARDAPGYNGLLEIMRADPAFDPAEFVAGARAAYEMIVTAFAGGDRRTLKDLLSREVYEGFEAAIRDRETRGERVETQFVSIDKADIADAMLRARSAEVTVRFQSKLITATRDKTGAVIDGSPEKVIDVIDIWTFAREVTARDPNWRLIATESAQ
ncbi:Tim44/TimA family putative adaptor protein [Rhabdaerophilum calidifontis]|uniref:Tim44/TimA family putative adaptor protein n=1 Tax=Rhabdaerophilum calidifontis TaxID=2604328 RepID=UPI001238F278|nr:Tim44/TimA family putative adaptor protein [Rhabdaerophilum calidifontis]